MSMETKFNTTDFKEKFSQDIEKLIMYSKRLKELNESTNLEAEFLGVINDSFIRRAN